MLAAIRLIAPGTPLREGLDRILQADTGGLIVIGGGTKVEQLCSGGFMVETQLTPQRMSELSKMDGALILDDTTEVIMRANVHLVPDASIPTTETGTRHRTAERVARQTAKTVVSLSQRMGQVTVYVDDQKWVMQPVALLLGKANQAVATLERYRARFDAVSAALSALEVEDLVTGRDVLLVLQRGEMVRRISEELDAILVELGTEGRLLDLQVDELVAGVDTELELVARDYLPDQRRKKPLSVLDQLSRLATEQLSDLRTVAVRVGMDPEVLEAPLSPRGFRFLSSIPRLPLSLVERIVGQFDSLQKILNATLVELDEVEGVGEARALQIKEGLARLAEASILDRYA